MVDRNRRKLLKTSGTAIGLSAIPSAVTATKGKQKNGTNGLTIHKKTVLSENNDKTVFALDITVNKGSSTSGGDATRKRFITTVKKPSGAVSVSEVNSQKFDKLTSSGEVSIASTDNEVSVSSGTVTVKSDTDIVKQSDVYAHNNGQCAAYDYTHRWAAVTAEFVNEVGDLGWGSISAALISLVGSSSLSAGASAILTGVIALVGGIAAYVTNTYSITFAGAEWDESAAGWNQTMYSARVAGGYHKSEGELTTISTAPGHPGRL
ncbi:hypothetical protein [Halorussus sp. MSC15.2]|uniref:hypothetical protein n=1 Tax=Halorussus sp. MSC15.2 TaxID=2283638 RepID=UPI0013D1A3B0|nr:hypothetical protein [Halorussus sp. MSC15.2]NEU57907.1 hypothetical protein [Halorussus sp. MSC15.2]